MRRGNRHDVQPEHTLLLPVVRESRPVRALDRFFTNHPPVAGVIAGFVSIGLGMVTNIALGVDEVWTPMQIPACVVTLVAILLLDQVYARVIRRELARRRG